MKREFVKLTRDDGRTAFMRVANIKGFGDPLNEALARFPKANAAIWFLNQGSHGESAYVRETPEEILALIEGDAKAAASKPVGLPLWIATRKGTYKPGVFEVILAEPDIMAAQEGLADFYSETDPGFDWKDWEIRLIALASVFTEPQVVSFH
jgi:hypothetical protein